MRKPKELARVSLRALGGSLLLTAVVLGTGGIYLLSWVDEHLEGEP